MTASSDQRKTQPILGCIADDVTGATDLASNLVQGGLRVIQTLGIPAGDTLQAISDCDAIVVALKSRSVPAADAVAESLQALAVLKSTGIKRFYFKYCSTFDSTPQGNIGPVAEALMDAVGTDRTVFCPAFPAAGRTVYQGHLFVNGRLLNESGMEHHPLNPMTDSSVLRLLEAQTSRHTGLLPYEALSGSDELRRRIDHLSANGAPLIVADACDDQHLATLAAEVASWPLVTGGSGLARFLPQAWRNAGVLSESGIQPPLPEVEGRSLIIAGSCSQMTNRQVQWMSQHCPHFGLDIVDVVTQPDREHQRMASWAEAAESSCPLLVSSTALPDVVQRLQEQFSRDQLAAAIEDFLAETAYRLVDHLQVRRLVLAGGETSGAVVRRLGIQLLEIGPDICPGVPWTTTRGRCPQLALALKSGNFGDDRFFQTALEMLP